MFSLGETAAPNICSVALADLISKELYIASDCLYVNKLLVDGELATIGWSRTRSQTQQEGNIRILTG